MIPPIPIPEDYRVSTQHGFLPAELPLTLLPDPYYNKWEAVVANLQALLLSKRLREVAEGLPVLSTSRLKGEPEWRRAYVLLAFMAHAYIWGGDKPQDRLPPSISIPLLSVSAYLELPPVATYAAVCLWNYRPIFPNEPIDNIENLSTVNTFTGSLDESWFYVVSIAIEARGAPIIPLMLKAIAAARIGDSRVVAECLRSFAERLDGLCSLLQRMYEACDPHVFYHRIRPFLAGSKNMGDAGLPNGVMYVDENGQETWRQYSGGPHRRFLEHVSTVANIRDYVESHRSDRALCVAFDSCLAMLRTFRDKHIQMVSRYIIIKSRESRTSSRSISPRSAPQPINIAAASTRSTQKGGKPIGQRLRGTGGTALIPFLKQARDETGEPAIDAWARRLLSNGGDDVARLSKLDEHANGEVEVVGLAGTWAMDDSEGGLCHW
ncbi:hypothetical protein GP486_005070 [Trichoglossum hirsutum]|uniref:Indoleamine 2,3-dioxygenase n=1 Tax=Trichoglossum hirsutum TaxID=265104 RepID=A0A9P8RNH7_9PEZI|nr:hypothetical protein GP486_005070 [Trichoglossum hirsutum]